MLILALGGHEFSRRRGNEALRDYMLGLVETERPRICLLPTASGDTREQIAAFRQSMGSVDCQMSDLSLFRLEGGRSALREHLLRQDIVYVGGGSMVNMLAVWRAHGIDRILREAWRSGTVLVRSERGGDVLVRVGHHALHGSGPSRTRSRPASRKPVRPPSPRPGPPAGPAPGRFASDSARLRSRRPSGAAVPGRRAGGAGERQARGGGVAGRERQRRWLRRRRSWQPGGSPTRARLSTSRMRTWPSCGAPSRRAHARGGHPAATSSAAGWAGDDSGTP